MSRSSTARPRANARQPIPATDPGVTEKQRKDLDAWKASQLAKAPVMDEATARRVSVVLWPIDRPQAGNGKSRATRKGGEAA